MGDETSKNTDFACDAMVIRRCYRGEINSEGCARNKGSALVDGQLEIRERLVI